MKSNNKLVISCIIIILSLIKVHAISEISVSSIDLGVSSFKLYDATTGGKYGVTTTSLEAICDVNVTEGKSNNKCTIKEVSIDSTWNIDGDITKSEYYKWKGTCCSGGTAEWNAIINRLPNHEKLHQNFSINYVNNKSWEASCKEALYNLKIEESGDSFAEVKKAAEEEFKKQIKIRGRTVTSDLCAKDNTDSVDKPTGDPSKCTCK